MEALIPIKKSYYCYSSAIFSVINDTLSTELDLFRSTDLFELKFDDSFCPYVDIVSIINKSLDNLGYKLSTVDATDLADMQDKRGSKYIVSGPVVFMNYHPCFTKQSFYIEQNYGALH